MKLLIVDDHKFFRDEIYTFSSEYGFEVEFASNGKEAIEKYFEFKPDIMTLDIDMPIHNGLYVLENIIKEDKEANIIMCSSLVGIKYYADKAFSLGAKAVLPKPFTQEEFDVVLSEVLEMMEK